jgi:hypothetical protein
MYDERHSYDLAINSIFEMLPDRCRKFAFHSDRDPDKTWSEGKRVWMVWLPDGMIYGLMGDDISHAISVWEDRAMNVFDAFSLTESDAIMIIETAIKEKKWK